MLFILLFNLLIFHFNLAQCSIYLGFPLNEQLPNVGRTNQQYSFTIANTTYKSNSDGHISYQADNLPSWLSFDSDSRTFTGSPQQDNVGEFQITLIGTDSSDNSQLINNYTMLVSNDTGLHLKSQDSLIQQLTQSGQTNGLNGLVVKPGETIDLKFNTDIFESYSTSDRPIIAYYGRSMDRSSLPNWLTFNSDDNSFSGTAPYVTSENAPSFEYGFSFIASDYYGYTGAQGDFKIIVGGHQLSTSINQTIKINGSYGDSIHDEVPVYSQVYLDGVVISNANVSNIYSNDLPDYLQLSNTTLTGRFPNSSTFDNFSIIVDDIYGNSVELSYSFTSLDTVFTTNFNDVNATRGKFFEFEILQSYFTNFNQTQVDVDIDSDWLAYHESNMTLYGVTPDDFNSLEVKINGDLNNEQETKSFYIRGIDGITSTSSSTTSSSSTSSTYSSSSTGVTTTTSESNSTTSSDVHKQTNNKALAIGLGVGIPVFVLLVAALILFCCCFKRRRDQDTEKSFDDEATTTSHNGLALPIDPKEDSASICVMKLDKVHSNSSASTLTHVESSEDDYYDAPQQQLQELPVVKSWRANAESDDKTPNLVRQSDASLSTVNTEQLFSVRLVDDQSYRNSYSSSQLLSSNSINNLLKRDNSISNIQRLDSDGNIVDKHNSQAISNLDIVPEEHHYHQQHVIDETSGSISNLLSKFDENTPSNSSSEQDMKHLSNEVNESPNQKVMNTQLNFSNLSVNSQNSDKFRYIDNSSNTKNNINIDKLAKLVDFTRKASLRESAHEPDYHHKEESATIHNDSD